MTDGVIHESTFLILGVSLLRGDHGVSLSVNLP